MSQIIILNCIKKPRAWGKSITEKTTLRVNEIPLNCKGHTINSDRKHTRCCSAALDLGYWSWYGFWYDSRSVASQTHIVLLPSG